MSRLLVTYEWEWACVDEHEDIIEVQYQEPGALARVDGMWLYALVKNYGNEVDGIKDRAWADVDSGSLPDSFNDGTKVPAKLAIEFNRVMGGLH